MSEILALSIVFFLFSAVNGGYTQNMHQHQLDTNDYSSGNLT